QLLFLGLGTPRQATVLPESRYFEKGFDTAYAQYDPAQANKLLDSMGLKKDKDGFRLRPDGKPLTLTAEFNPSSEAPEGEVWELVKNYWEKIGIKVALKPDSPELLSKRRNANELEVTSGHLDRCTDILFTLEPQWFVPISSQTTFAPLWYTWYSTGGKSGEEPPKEIKRLWQIFNDEFYSTTSEAKRTAMLKEAMRLHSDNLWIIGTVGVSWMMAIVKNNLRNVPESGFAWHPAAPGVFRLEQFFFKK
ncbi:MAG TPA: ABC transporter substrate-binding protein, partial [bacterium]|nr:ABC transporter substrate-binding protein [bacterium]